MGTRKRRTNENKDVVIVVNSWLKKHGSFEDYLVAMAVEAPSSNFKITFVLPGIENEQIAEALLKAGAIVLVADQSWDAPEGRRQIARMVQETRPNMVNFHFCDPQRFLPLFIRCWAKRIPVVFHYHGEIRPIETLGWRNRHFSIFRQASYFWTLVVTVSHANEQFLRALRVRRPIYVVYNGIDVPRFVRICDEQQKPQKDGQIRCLYIGSLTKRKRVDLLLAAFSIVCSKLPEAKLTIVGGGELESTLKTYAKERGLTGAVEFKGLLPDFPFDLLASCDIFVSASESESFGLVFAEAMSFERPVVACRVGGIPEVVKDGTTGILASVNDPDAFATAVLELAANADLRCDMGNAARATVASRFQLRTCIAATLNVFKVVV